MPEYPEHLGHPEICGGLPHPVVTIAVHWCPHRQAWTVSRTEGPAEGPLTAATWPLGPFDGPKDAIAFAMAKLTDSVAAIAIRER